MIPTQMDWLTTEKIVFLYYLDYSNFQFVSNVNEKITLCASEQLVICNKYSGQLGI